MGLGLRQPSKEESGPGFTGFWVYVPQGLLWEGFHAILLTVEVAVKGLAATLNPKPNTPMCFQPKLFAF